MTKTILVVGVHDRERGQLVATLERQHHRVLQAATTYDAARILDVDAPALLIVDGPLADGQAWLSCLRRSGIATPAILLSASAQADPGTLDGALGVCRVVVKPIIPSVFTAQVRSHMAATRRPSQLETRASVPREVSSLRAQYVRHVPERLRELRDAVRTATLESNRRGLVDARRRARQLGAMAASYGLHSVSASAAAVEDALAALLDARCEAAPEPWARIETIFVDAIAAATSSAVSYQPSATLTVGHARLLVVDGDPQFLRFAEENARAELVLITAIATATRAMERARATKFDGALIDVLLEPPGISFDLANRLRALPGCGSLPIAFTSTDGDIHNRVAAAQCGAALFLLKPLDTYAFAAALNTLTSMREVGRPRVLVVDEHGDRSARRASALRRAGVLAATVGDTTLVLEALDRARPDLLLLGAAPSSLDPFDVCRMLRTTPRWQGLAIVVEVAEEGSFAWNRALEAGADDVIPPSIHEDELVARVLARMKRARWSTDLAGRDALTELWLRRKFMEELSVRLAEARRHKLPLTLAMLDLDEFKLTNDLHGHLAGDRVLMGLGKLLRSCFRSEDLRCRWGGEEFAVAFPCESPEEATPAVLRLLDELRATDFQSDSGEVFHVTLSAGVADFPADGDTLDMLLRVADRRLYQAKRGGRARVVREG